MATKTAAKVAPATPEEWKQALYDVKMENTISCPSCEEVRGSNPDGCEECCTLVRRKVAENREDLAGI